VHTRLLGFGLTAGLLGFLVVALAATAVLPRLLQKANLGESLESVLSLLQWPAVAFGMLAVAAVLYRIAETQATSSGHRISLGTWVATLTWLVSSVGFASFFGAAPRIEASYGALAAAAVTLLWFWLFAGSLLLGAEIDRIALRSDRPRRQRRAGEDVR
jgi:membrane protein